MITDREYNINSARDTMFRYIDSFIRSCEKTTECTPTIKRFDTLSAKAMKKFDDALSMPV